MLIDVTLPQLGESVAEGTISKWLVREGDSVDKDQPLVEIATDKADSELPSPVSGRIAKILVFEGAVAPIKAVLCQIEEGARGASQPRAAQPSRPESAAPQAAPPPPAMEAVRTDGSRAPAGLSAPSRSVTG